MNGGDGFGVIASGVELRHAHAAETLGGNFETGTSKIAGFHKVLSEQKASDDLKTLGIEYSAI
jgi:hypothetical protein